MIYDLGGTLRALTPEQTLRKLKPLLLEVFGITRVADVTGLDTIGIPVSVCIRPNSKTLSTSQGKGITPELAQISAIMESIETWHAEQIPVELLVSSSYLELSKSCTLPALDHLLQSFISYPDVLSRQLPWLKVDDMMQQQTAYVPYALLCLDTVSRRSGQELFIGTSNGLASGNTLEEAVCHGLCESIERDCIAEFERLSLEAKLERRVRVESIDSPHNQELIERIHAAGCELYVFEITNRLGLASFAAELDDRQSLRSLGLFGGYGAHLSRDIALARAISEAVQSRLTMISGSRDDYMPTFYYTNTARHMSYPDLPMRNFSDCQSDKIPDNFKDCISLLLNKLRQQQINHVFLFNQTRPELDIAVVNVIIPELDFEWRSHRMVA